MSPAAKKPKLEKLPSFGSQFYPYNKHKTNRELLEKYTKDENKPFHILQRTIEETEGQRNNVKVQNAVAHWFVRDFRQLDNRGLSQAGLLAAKHGVPLITFYVYCLPDLQSHSISSWRLQYQLRALTQLQNDLKQKNIPLFVLNVVEKKDIAKSVIDFLQKYKVSHLFANIEYEVDELRLYAKLVKSLLKKEIDFNPQNDTCVVIPGELKTKSKGTQYAVFTPWYRAWCQYINSNEDEVLHEAPAPKPNDEKVFSGLLQLKELFKENSIPKIPKQYHLTEEQQKFFDQNWYPSEHAAYEELTQFLTSKDNKIKKYADLRNDINTNATSHLSHHLSLGTLNSRTIIREIVQRHKLVKKVNLGHSSITEYIRQVSWRDFYKHVLANWPHVCMFRPFQIEYDELQWEYNREHFDRWCQGQTGFPIVDAAMREIQATGYMHNRSRMIVASFLSKHLMTDWRHGELFFLEHLVDGDFASNSGGWGFSSSVGVDPQPFFRIFNPWTQSEKFDKEGKYIKKWVPELREIDSNKGIHNPYEHGFAEIAEKNNYPRPIVDHHDARERALDRYKDVKY